MNITPATNTTPQTAHNVTQNLTPIKPLTIEIAEPIRISLSGEGIYLSELAERASEGYKMPQISQSSIKTLEFDMKLMRQLKTQRLAGQSTGNNVEDLAIAYDNLQKNLNENSENSQKHGKFLDDAFKNVARFFFVQDAQRQYLSGIDYNDETQNPNLSEDAAKRLKQAIAVAEKKSVAFADSFIKNYKKQGLEAYNTVMSSF